MGTKTGKKVVVTCGLVGLMMFGFIPHGNAGHVDNPFTITAQAAESYSENWKVDSNGDWRFYNNDGSVVSNAWIHDRGEWYLVDGTGTMMTGVFQSNEGKYYLLDTVRGSGTYGKLLTNGKVYSGITLNCDTNPVYEGALSAETINSLKALGIRFDNVPNVTNTQHIEATEVESQTHHTSTPPSNQGTQSNQSTSSSQSNNSTDDSSWMYDYGMTDEMWKEISDSVVGSNYGNLH